MSHSPHNIRTASAEARGRGATAALLIAHCAGMLDLVALPVWVGAALIGSMGLAPAQAGLLVTLFLAGQVMASLVLAPRFGRWPAQRVIVGGFALATLAFASLFLVQTYVLMALLHALGGIGAGTALSCVHGLMGRSANPHRVFAMAGLALGLFGILVLGSGPVIVEKAGAATLFVLFALATFTAAVAALMWLGQSQSVAENQADSSAPTSTQLKAPIPKVVWMGMLGIGCMSLANAMLFSFVERIGMDRGYGLQTVTSILIGVGLFNLVPPVLAALLEKRLAAGRVLLAGPVCQLLLALAVTQVQSLWLFAFAAVVWVGVMIFTHTFLFGLIARLDTSGRALAATPAMLMIGSAIGPLLAGVLVDASGYQGLGLMVAMVAVLAFGCFLRLQWATDNRAAVVPRSSH
ncbi:MFS transporter [Parathalassolituus penaei]|uniref:MFS transporter n=1 Tax=Parathalassolituus penaei TaxID=2997323 RepID=A0A9X3EAM7_9GAMM|nr:MFS transporter [Parathalassolituus penaei]MCY0964037.1 MFS transporter [Parathalassolituus penaei]